jgi:tetratricopeptide (TPR) repeat protein
MRYSLNHLVAGLIYLALIIGGCHRRQAAITPPAPPPPPLIIRTDAPVAVYSPIPGSLPVYVPPSSPGDAEREKAQRAFTAGNYDEAILAYESLLVISPSGDGTDEALFRLGLCYVLRNKGEADWHRGTNVLRQLINEYPASTLKPPAAVILTLRSQANDLAGEIKLRDQAMKQLSLELERLKKIDADRGRRR